MLHVPNEEELVIAQLFGRLFMLLVRYFKGNCTGFQAAEGRVGKTRTEFCLRLSIRKLVSKHGSVRMFFFHVFSFFEFS